MASASNSAPSPLPEKHSQVSTSPQVPYAKLEAGRFVSTTTLDIEHVQVYDDPRLWSETRKYVTLGLIACASLIATMGTNIYNPAIMDIKAALSATDQEISLSLSLFTLVQGCTPLFWTAVSEIKGRKYVYLISILLFTIGCTVGASSRHIGVLIGMRILQALGGSAVLAVGAGTLADIYDRKERGTKLGIYYSIPLLGPSIGPVLGGILTDAFDWRATFWFLVILGGIMWFAFLILFKDTFRRERSLAYQRALQRARAASARRKQAEFMKAQERLSRPATPAAFISRPASFSSLVTIPAVPKPAAIHQSRANSPAPPHIPEEPIMSIPRSQTPASFTGTFSSVQLDDIKLSLADVNPFHPLKMIVQKKNNLTVLLPSALLFAFTFSISYTSVRTLALNPYNYNALKVGLVLLSFGIGNVFGSIAAGKYSDYLLRSRDNDLTNGEEPQPELRLKSTFIMMWVLPPSVVLYAWFAQERLHVAAICIALFLAGFSTVWVYTGALAYIVDANVGRSSTAVATNNCFRGTAAFIAAEVAVPIQDGIGDSGLYMIWAGLLAVMEALLLLTAYRGSAWREEAQKRENEAAAAATA